MVELLKKIRQICIGFPIVTKLENHYTGAEYRIFVKMSYGIVTVFCFDDKFTCKSQRFIDDIKVLPKH